MARRKLTQEQLVANSRHLLYEIQMFGHTDRLVQAIQYDPEGPFDENIKTLALIESHLTHARSLMRFLYPSAGAWDTDMYAADYLRDVNVLQDKWPEFDADLRGIDKELAHLTYLRPPKPTRWDINNKLSPRLLSFIWAVDSSRVYDKFQPLALAALVDASTFITIVMSAVTGRTSVPVATQSLQRS